MTGIHAPAKFNAFLVMFGWRRLRVVFITSVLVSLLMLPGWLSPYWALLGRLFAGGALLLLVFGLFERWPAKLARWLARWMLQVFAVAIAAPCSFAIIYWLTNLGLPESWWQYPAKMTGFSIMAGFSVFLAPWIALGAIVLQREALAREQALAFDLERSELERKALDARLRLLQAQVEPHFLFNTLANVQTLVDAGSPQAANVVKSLIAYLRAAVPRLHESATTLGQEAQLVRAYLEVMQMRMPDRLIFTIQVDEAAKALQCPPMTLLTLVENAVRHGIDPREDGGRIDVEVRRRDGLCQVRVTDTGAGLAQTAAGLGTGLSSLRERLQLTFGGNIELQLTEIEPHGVRAELAFPARQRPQ